MFSIVHTDGGQCWWRHVLVLVAVVFFALSAVTEPFAATAKKPSGSWNSTSFVTTGDDEPASLISVEPDCAKAVVTSHATTSNCMTTVTGVLSFSTSNDRFNLVYSPETSLKTAGNKPPHGPPKSIFLI